jgi:hypothetical protein
MIWSPRGAPPQAGPVPPAVWSRLPSRPRSDLRQPRWFATETRLGIGIGLALVSQAEAAAGNQLAFSATHTRIGVAGCRCAAAGGFGPTRPLVNSRDGGYVLARPSMGRTTRRCGGGRSTGSATAPAERSRAYSNNIRRWHAYERPYFFQLDLNRNERCRIKKKCLDEIWQRRSSRLSIASV